MLGIACSLPPCKPSRCFSPAPGHAMRPRSRSRRHRMAARAEAGEPNEKPNPGLGLQAVWYGAEQFGNIIGLTKPRIAASKSNGKEEAISRADAIAAIRRDYDSKYFVSGRGDMLAYEEDCLFTDPFAGFNGVERFQKNVSNLGGLMEDIKLDITDWREEGEALKTRWRFSAILSLPWWPRLAAAGGTMHVFSKETGRVIKHLEEWDVEPGPVVRSLIRPSARMPTNQWEAFMLALDQGDPGGAWLAASRPALKYFALPVVGVSLLAKAVTGEGLPGLLAGGIEGIAYLTAACAVVTEAYKLVKQAQGVD